MTKLYTKSLGRSNHLFDAGQDSSSHTVNMALVEKVDAILKARDMGWSDLARAMKLSEQRVNNWRTRGIPAAKIRDVESALGLKRYALDEENPEANEAAQVVAEFTWLYKNVTAEGRSFIRDMLVSVKRSFVTDERRSQSLHVVNDRRNKA